MTISASNTPSTWVDLPGITLRPLASHGLRIEIAPEAPDRYSRELEVRIEEQWALARAANPRLYDAPMLHVERADAEQGAIVTRRERYRRLVAGPALGFAFRLLAVTGMVIGRDASGRAHALFGRRGSQTRVYPGLWELGPSGGIACPPEGVRELDLSHVRAALIEEGLEELGVSLEEASISALAMVGDDFAASDDIVLRVELPRPIDPRRTPCRLNDADAWEYLDTAWAPLDAIAEWTARSPDAFIPPTLALIRHLRWS